MHEENEFKLLAECVLLDIPADDWRDSIRKACQPLIGGGFVKAGYPEDVIARERQWATGLPTMPVGVAIPHALTPDNVIEAQIAACRLASPVKFSQSGGTETDEDIDVLIVFILALKDPQKQLHLLQKLMIAISDETTLTALLQASAPSEFSNIFNRSASSDY